MGSIKAKSELANVISILFTLQRRFGIEIILEAESAYVLTCAVLVQRETGFNF